MKLILCVVIAALAVATSSTAYGLKNPQTAKWESQSSLNNKNINFCRGCRALVSYATRYNSSSARGESRKLFQGFCETLYPVSTDFQQGPCPIFVEGLFWFMDRIDPVNHCDQIGACGPEDANVGTMEDLVDGASDNNNMIPSVRDGGVACEACEQVVTYVQGVLQSPAYVDGLKKQLNSFCDYLAILNESKECKDLINGYIDESIDFILQLQPLKYCQSIQLCSSTNNQKSSASAGAATDAAKTQKMLSQSLASFKGFGIETKVVVGDRVLKDISNFDEQAERGHGPTCMFCKAFVKEMFKFLKDNRTENNIRVGLDKICTLIYRKNRSEFEHCESLVATYSKELVQLLVDETDPELVCVLVEQCTYQPTLPKLSAQSSVELMPMVAETDEKEQPLEPVDLNMLISMLDPTVQPSSIATCVECKIFIQYLRNSIGNPKSAEDVHQWLIKNLCDSLGDKKMKDSCYNMVDSYAAIFFKAIATDLDPKKACIELKACNQRVRQSLNILDRPPIIERKIKPQVNAVKVRLAPTQVKSQICDQCVMIVTQIDDYLSSHPIDHDVSVLIDQVCNQLPVESAKSECAAMIKVFGQDIAQMIATMDNPKQLCSKIMLC